MIRTLLCALALVAAPTVAAAADANPTLFPGTLDMPLPDGTSVPDDCRYPEALQDTARFDLACVIVPANADERTVNVSYISWLGQHQFRAGDEVIGGFTAVRPGDNGCEQVLEIFTYPYPPEQAESDDSVIWFALERNPRCSR